MKPLLVGESNPYRRDQRYALWPSPVGCAGWRLCHVILGMDAATYLREYDRTNLVSGAWNAQLAKDEAEALAHQARILLGSKVAAAHGLKFDPFTIVEKEEYVALILPHPSGRCRIWNDAGKVELARRMVGVFTGRVEAWTRWRRGREGSSSNSSLSSRASKGEVVATKKKVTRLPKVERVSATNPEGRVDVKATEQQAKLLDAILRITNQRGIPPTIRELAKETSESPSMVVIRLRQLEKMGLVKREPRISRSVRVA